MAKIEFYDDEIWDNNSRTVVWVAQIKDVDATISCRISSEVLRDRFQAISAEKQELLQAFKLNRREIERVAERLINSGRFESDGTIVIQIADI